MSEGQLNCGGPSSPRRPERRSLLDRTPHPLRTIRVPRKDFAGRLQVRSALPNTGSITEGQVAERKDDKKGLNSTGFGTRC